MALLTPQSRTSATNLVVTMTAATSGGDNIDATNGPVFVLFANRDVASKTVTVKSFATNVPPGTAKTDLAVTVAAGNVAVLGPFDAAVFGDTSTQVELTYSAVTSCFVGTWVNH